MRCLILAMWHQSPVSPLAELSNAAMMAPCFVLPWQKHSLEKKLERAIKKLPEEEAAVSTIQAMVESVFQHFDIAYQLFAFYATIGTGDDVFSISRQGYAQLIDQCDLADEELVGQRAADLNIIFEGVNAKQTKDEKFNHKKTLNREEWLGVLVQIVLTRHVASEDAMAVGPAFDRFFEELRVRIPGDILHDSNAFRTAYCYPEAVDFVLKSYEKQLRVIYEVFAYGDGAIGDELRSTKLMDISEYNLLIDSLDMIDQWLTARDVEQAFAFCRMLVIDETSVKGRARLLQLRFEDFLEVVVRIAFMKVLPTDAELEASGCQHAGDFLAKLSERPEAEKKFHEERLRPLDEPPSQPMAHQVRHFVNWMIYHVRGGVDSDRDLTSKEAEKFRKGIVRMVRQEASVDDSEVLNVPQQTEDDDIELVRVGGPGLAKHEAETVSGD
jgi:hypothetical protein